MEERSACASPLRAYYSTSKQSHTQTHPHTHAWNMAGQCASSSDRSKACRTCGGKAHIAKSCTKEPSCMFYRETPNVDAKCVAGSGKCPLPNCRTGYQSAEVRMLQIDLKYGEAAHDLLRQTIIEKEVELVLLGEPYRRAGQGTWIIDASKKAAMRRQKRGLTRLSIK